MVIGSNLTLLAFPLEQALYRLYKKGIKKDIAK